MNATKDLVLNYFEAWQARDWKRMRPFLSPKFTIDGGKIQFHSVDAFISFCQNGPSWSQIVLLDALFQDNKAALLYEGITPTGEKIRVGEFFIIEEGKIISSKVAISLG